MGLRRRGEEAGVTGWSGRRMMSAAGCASCPEGPERLARPARVRMQERSGVLLHPL